MPTILSHPAVALGLAPWFKRCARRPHVLAIGVALTALPDIDVIGLAFGIPYDHPLGHRGLTHSLLFAVVLSGVLAAWLARDRVLPRSALWAYFGACLASHGVLDAFTDGGLGVAFFAPFSPQRYFFDVRPILVSPIGARFFSERGLHTLASELTWVWIPCAMLALMGIAYGWLARRRMNAFASPNVGTDR